jgi:glycosyltransferase involved in cell wall biosynthesis
LRPPLVSVNIPTFNSAATLATTLQSVVNQSYSPIEILVADSFSRDSTAKIATDFGGQVVMTKNRLLGARRDALFKSNGKYSLLLDSDQILRPSTIERCVAAMDEFDMLMLEEECYEAKTWVQSLFETDRKMIYQIGTLHFDPIKGVMLPRFFRQDLLKAAFLRIPSYLSRHVNAHDHAIIYLEASRTSNRVGLISNAVYHQEPESFRRLWSKNFRVGRSLVYLLRSPYWTFAWSRTRLRQGRTGTQGASSSTVLLLMKSLPFFAGFAVESTTVLAKSILAGDTHSALLK